MRFSTMPAFITFVWLGGVASVSSAAEEQSMSPAAEQQPRAPDTLLATISAPLDEAKRPVMLMPLYGSIAALQTFDVYTTIRAMRYGGREANPIVRNSLEMPLAISLVKGASTAAVLFAAERLWRQQHRTAAVIMMIGVNAGYAFLVAHNYAVVSSGDRTR